MTVAIIKLGRSLFEGRGLISIGGFQLLPSHEIFDELGIEFFLLYFIVIL